MKKRLLAMTAALLMGATTLWGQEPEVIRVGAYEVYVLQESAGEGNAGVLIDAPADVLAQYAPGGRYPTATNAVLVRRGDRVWLMDTGFGRTIFERMAALGIQPGDVDEVLISHMHGDHIGGMLRNEAKAFPNATVSLSRREFDHWTGVKDEASLKIFAAYDGALKILSPAEIDVPVQQGITPVAAYGHTPGHTMFMIKDGDNQLLIWADIAHAMAVQMPHPEISVRYDTDPAAARESRLKVLRHVSTNDIPVVGMHIPATTAGHVAASGEGYVFRDR
jgi:glyoxylase-like metal-dependent hydrolase (beta-lactamase superfamily II)